jgi:hypothetical protein
LRFNCCPSVPTLTAKTITCLLLPLCVLQRVLLGLPAAARAMERVANPNVGIFRVGDRSRGPVS